MITIIDTLPTLEPLRDVWAANALLDTELEQLLGTDLRARTNDEVVMALQSAFGIVRSDASGLRGVRFFDRQTEETVAELPRETYEAWVGDEKWKGGTRVSQWICLWETRTENLSPEQKARLEEAVGKWKRPGRDFATDPALIPTLTAEMAKRGFPVWSLGSVVDSAESIPLRIRATFGDVTDGYAAGTEAFGAPGEEAKVLTQAAINTLRTVSAVPTE